MRGNMRIGDFELLSDEGRDQAAASFNANRDRAGAAKNVKDLQASFKKAEKALKDGSGSQEAVDALAVEIGVLEAALESAKDAANEAGSDNSLLMPLPPMEYVGKGARFHWDFNARGITEAQAGMIITGLHRWADGSDTRSPCFLGAHETLGFGRFLGEIVLQARDGGFRSQWRTVGTVRFDPKVAPDRGRGDREMGAGME